MPIHYALRQWTMQIPRRRIHRATLTRGPRAGTGKPQIGSPETRGLLELKKYRDCLAHSARMYARKPARNPSSRIPTCPLS